MYRLTLELGARFEDLRYVIALLRSEHHNNLADQLLDFTENRLIRTRCHLEKGTPSQVVNAWERLSREDERPS